jgi:hypothetical protein
LADYAERALCLRRGITDRIIATRQVDTMEGKPASYKITVVRDAFDRPLGAGAPNGCRSCAEHRHHLPLAFPNSTGSMAAQHCLRNCMLRCRDFETGPLDHAEAT